MFGKLKFRLRHLLGVLRRFSGTRHAEPSKANLTYTSWDGLKLSTNVLNNKCEGFEHLASAFDSLLRCVEMFEDKVRARQDYAKLGMDMDELFSIFAQYLEQVVPPSITSDSATRLARGINKEAKVLLNHEEGHRQEEDMDSIENVDEALKCYRQVRTSLALFVVSFIS
ncbi:hypothetical protein FRC09_007450 [Ceratobasidium sp. 395]|nr:hypothetical protein FRC09_007450 [Ceratobasidium sp. 395]